MPTYFSIPEAKLDSHAIVPRSTHSFTRLDPSPARSSTLKLDLDPASVTESAGSSPELSEDEGDQTPLIPDPLPQGWDGLPPEIITQCDKFMGSLKQKQHPAPINGDQLSDIFQQFYNVAFDSIHTYTSTLYVALSSKKKVIGETQMLSISEISQKKKDRRMLTAKRFALEEAVERKVTGEMYDRIWRHRSTDDEARDESLRSKRETLKVLGVSLRHLGVAGVEDLDMIEALEAAREALRKMTEATSPIGKLNLLRQCHKEIVDVLSSRNSDSSADRILPTFIFCLIHCPADVTVVSDLLFIQRFRMKKSINGEVAYCLTNLEAAICFLETVDLASLKLDDNIGSTTLDMRMDTIDKNENSRVIASALAAGSSSSTESASASIPAPSRTQSRGRQPTYEPTIPDNPPDRSESSTFVPADDPLSNLSSKLLSAKTDYSLRVTGESWEPEVEKAPSSQLTRSPDSTRQLPSKTLLQPSPPPTGGGTEAVRNRALSYLTKNPVVDVAESVVMGADVGLKTIGDALGGSYKFLFGRMDEKRQEMPKTLEDARRLVEQPAAPSLLESTERKNDLWDSNSPLPSPPPLPLPVRLGDREKERMLQPAAAFAAVGTGLSRVVGMGSEVVMRGFTRSSSSLSLDKEKEKDIAGATTAAVTTLGVTGADPQSSLPLAGDLLTAFPDLASPLLQRGKQLEAVATAAGPSETMSLLSIPTVAERFMNVADVSDLKIGELHELLAEYKKLGQFVHGLGLKRQQVGHPVAKGIGTFERFRNTWMRLKFTTQKLTLDNIKADISCWISADAVVMEIEPAEALEIEDGDEYEARLFEELKHAHAGLEVPQRKRRRRNTEPLRDSSVGQEGILGNDCQSRE